MWGPNADAEFVPVTVTCIQRSHVSVKQIKPGQTATLALEAAPAAGPLPDNSANQINSDGRNATVSPVVANTPFNAADQHIKDTGYSEKQQQGGMHDSEYGRASHTTAAGTSIALADHSRLLDSLITPDVLLDGSQMDDDDYHHDDAKDDDDNGSDNDSMTHDSSGFDFDLTGSDLTEPDGADPLTPAAVHSAPSQASISSSSTTDVMTMSASTYSLGSVSRSESADRLVKDSSADACIHANSRLGIAAHEAATPDGLGQQLLFTQTPHTVQPSAAVSIYMQPPSSSLSYSRHPAAPLSIPSSPISLGSSPPNWRKGAVLLDCGAAPRTSWEFEAVLVLLGGHWPPRGLLSGCWPPCMDEQLVQGVSEGSYSGSPPGTGPDVRDTGSGCTSGSDTSPGAARLPAHTRQQLQEGVKHAGMDADTATAATAMPGPCRSLPKDRRKKFDYAYVIHCNSVRQVAKVQHMQEIWDESHQQQADDVNNQQQQQQPVLGMPTRSSVLSHKAQLSGSIQAAAALLQSAHGVSSDRDSGEAKSARSSDWGGASDVGSVVHVRFRFAHRPEWLKVGSRLIARDRSDGHVAAAGFMKSVALEP